MRKKDLPIQVVRWVLFVCAAILPVIVLPWTSLFLEINKQALLVITAAVSLAGILLSAVINGKMRVRHTLLDWGVGAMVLASLITAITGISFDRSFFGLPNSLNASLVSIISLGILYFAVVQVFEDKGRAFRKVLLASTTLAILFGLLQLLAVYVFSASIAHSRVFNTIGSPNTLGVLAAIMLPLFLCVRLAPKKFWFLDVSYVGFIASVAVLSLLNWWLLWVIAVAGMLVLVSGKNAAPSIGGNGRLQRFVIPMIVIIAAVVMTITGISVSSTKALLPVEIVPNYSLSFNIASNVISERALIGYGPEQFSIAFDRYGASQISNSTLSDATFYDSASEAITMIVEGGLIGLIALLSLVVVVGVALFRLVKASDAADEITGTTAALVAVGVALFLYPFNITITFILFALVALTGLSMVRSEGRVFDVHENPWFSLSSSLGFIAGVVLVLVGLYAVGMAYMADVAYTQGLNKTTPKESIERLTAAASRNEDSERVYIALSQSILGLLNQDISAKPDESDTARTTRIQNNMTAAIGIAKRATELAPKDASAWLNLAAVYQSMMGLLNGSDKLSEEALLKSMDLRPGDPGLPNKLGILYLTKADLYRQFMRSQGANIAKLQEEVDAALVKSEGAFKQATEISPNFGQAIYNLGSVYERQGKLSESIRQIERIIPANANNPNLIFELSLLYYRAGRKNDALAALQRVVSLEPQYANARWYLALLYEERRDVPNAIAQVEKILETNKDNQVVMDKLQLLRAGKTEFPPGRVTDKKPI